MTEVDSDLVLSSPSEEGSSHLVDVDQAIKMKNVFPPVQYYFEHVLNGSPGVIYNNSEWENNKLVRVLSETVDSNS